MLFYKQNINIGSYLKPKYNYFLFKKPLLKIFEGQILSLEL